MNNNNTIDGFIEESKNKRIILFGAGNEMQKCLETIVEKNHLEIDYVVDNDFRKWYSNIWGYEVKNPLALMKESKDEIVVLITSIYPFRIESQLKEMGIDNCFSSLLFIDEHINKEQFMVMF